jgi:hypothetical protein
MRTADVAAETVSAGLPMVVDGRRRMPLPAAVGRSAMDFGL